MANATDNLNVRRWKTWAYDAAERAGKTFVQAFLATGIVTEGATLEVFAQAEPYSVAAAAAIFSVLSSLASKRTGSANTARLNG
jgi:hypothetical protein